jgi:hypothetical protein
MNERELEARQRAAVLQGRGYDHSFLGDHAVAKLTDEQAQQVSAALAAANSKSVNDLQVGGDHYKKMGIQPWDVIEANGYDFWEGSALSYLMRWRSKGGVADLEKAKHYIDKMIDLETKKGLEKAV